MPSRQVTSQPILTAAAAVGAGVPMMVTDFQDVMLDVSTTGSANLTFKVQASMNPPGSPPNFGAAASSSNKWFYLHSYDLENPASGVVGSTGYSFSGTDGVKGIFANSDLVNWINVEVTARSAGSLTVVATACTNE